ARDDWLSSTTAIIRRFGPRDPSTLSPSDASNLVWAVSGRSDAGSGTRIFAELDPPPVVGWLSEFSRREEEARTAHNELVARARRIDAPEPPDPPMHLTSLVAHPTEAAAPLSAVAYQLARWLVRHLDRLETVDWVAARVRNDRRLHPSLRSLIRR